jgi:hypothetical protein
VYPTYVSEGSLYRSDNIGPSSLELCHLCKRTRQYVVVSGLNLVSRSP